jgi:hypothetical protein
MPQQALPSFQYVIVNFYSGDCCTVQNEVFAMSEQLFLRDKDPYSPSVGYAQCDISKYPELALEGMK